MKDVYKKFHNIDAGKVLDAATGKGEFIQIIKQNFASFDQIIGIDSSEKAVKHTENLYPDNNIEIYRMDLENIGYEDNYFDTVTLSNSIHHLANPEVVLKELLRVLRPSGLLIITEMYQDGEQSPTQITHILMHHWIAKVDRLSGVFHQSTYTRQEIIDLIKRLNLSEMCIEDFNYPTDNPKNPQIIQPMINNFKEMMKRLENIENAQELINEGEEIIERIKQIGCGSANRVLISGFNNKGEII